MFEINGVIWQVAIVSPNHPALKMPGGKWAIGCCNPDTQTIYLSEEAAFSPQLRELLIHEVAHAAIASYGYQLPHNCEEFLAIFIHSHIDEIMAIVDTLI